MKKIMILMLSLAVLFSFAACDNSTGTGSTTNPDDLKIVEVVVKEGPTQYFAGEFVDVADYKVVGIQANGEEKELDAQFLSFSKDDTNQPSYAAGTTGLAAKAGVDNENVKPMVIGTISYVGPNMASNILYDSVSASVYNLNAISVERTGAAKVYYNRQDQTAVNRDDYTVMGYALNKAETAAVYERKLDNDEYTINAKKVGEAEDDTFDVGTGTTLTFVPAYGSNAATDKVKYNETAKITVEPDVVESISVKLVDKAEVIIDSVAGDPTSLVEVTYNMLSKVAVTSSELSTYTANTKVTWESGFAAGSKFADKEYTITAIYGTGDDAKSNTTTIKPVANYITDFTLALSDTADTTVLKLSQATAENDTLNVVIGKSFKASDLKVSKLTWADDSNEETKSVDEAQATAALKMTNGVSDVPTVSTANYANNDVVAVEFYLDLTAVNDDTACSITTVKAVTTLPA